MIDDSGDRKDGSKTAHVGHQWLGRYGKTDSGVVTVTTVWADERLYYPVHAVPYTPARHLAKASSRQLQVIARGDTESYQPDHQRGHWSWLQISVRPSPWPWPSCPTLYSAGLT